MTISEVMLFEERLLVKDLYVVSVQRDTIFESLALRQ